MWQAWQQFWRRPIIIIPLGLAVLLNISAWLLLFIKLPTKSKTIILHYTVFFGVDRIGRWEEALLIPFVGALLIIINSFFGIYFLNRHRLISSFFLIMTPILQALILLATVFVVILNLPSSI